MSDNIYNEIKNLVEKRQKFLLIGSHGLGKTEICKMISEELNLPMVYFASATLDPMVDIVGIPVPKYSESLGKMTIEYVRRDDLMRAKWIFFDEINRAHPKTQNALFEIIQFGTINGEPLPNLELVSAAINPPNAEIHYHVSEMDPALMDRFEHFIELEANPLVEIYTAKGIHRQNAERTIAWWNNLGKEIQSVVTPRRLEYILKAYEKGLDINKCVLPARMLANVKEIPMNSLKMALSAKVTTEKVKEKLGDYDANWIISNYQAAIFLSHQSESQGLSEAIRKMKASDLNSILPVLSQMKKEFQYGIHEHVAGSIEKASTKAKERFPDLFDWTVETRKKMNEDLAAPTVTP